jgi:tetratricopeptide (TPR) repeat protein
MTSGSEVRPLRGRRNEIATIKRALAKASEGHAAGVVLVGEPGIGKSRLATEAATLATRDGFATRWGRAWEAGGAPAYWPWRQLCEGMSREGAIAQLWGGRAGVAADPEQARFDVFDAVTRALASFAAVRPMLLILDDLHAADVPSLELLAFATRHLRTDRLAWVLSWRDAEGGRAPVRDQLSRIAREATVLSLGPLLEVETNELIDDVRQDANIELRNKLVRTTAGNPLFLLETLAALATGSMSLGDEQLPLAQGIATLVNDRVAHLPEETRALARAASVVGREVSLVRWAAAADRDTESLRRCAAALVGAGILIGQGPDRWRFGHDLVREAIYREAGDETSTIHRRIALALDREIAGGDVSLVGERAHHGLHARLATRTVLDWTIAAAEHARAQCAYEEAAAVLDRARAWLGSDAERDAALQLARGRALLDLGDATAARDTLVLASTLARKAGNVRMVAEVALAFGSRYVFGDINRDLLALLDQALAVLPEEETVLQARLLARKAAALTPALDPTPVLDMARNALEAIENVADDSVRLEVAVAAGAAFASIAHPREVTPNNELIVELARRCGDRALELRGLTRLVTDLALAGDFAGSDAVLPVRNALARSLVQPRFQWSEPLLRSMRAMVRGDFATCDAAVDEAESFRTRDPNAVRSCAVHRTWLYLYSDRVDKLVAHEPVVMEALATMTPTIRNKVRASIRLRSGDLEAARHEVDAIGIAHHFSNGSTGMAMLAEVIAEVGSEAQRRDIYERLAPFADSYAGWGLFGCVLGPPIAATLGDLAGALGDHERAKGHFQSALAMTTASGALVGRAWTGYWFARMLSRLGDPATSRVLDEAIRDATRANLEGVVARCRALGTPEAPRPLLSSPGIPIPFAWSLTEHAGAWKIEVGDRNFLIPNLRGMQLLARLAAQPHVEIHSLELVSGAHDPEVAGDAGDAGEMLDEKARTTYRRRIAELAELIDEAEARGDARRAEVAQREHEALIKELSRAVGLGGKVRRSGAAAERARVAAQRRLREAIKKIGELDAELGTHLDRAIRTGAFCVYRP